MSDGPSQTVQIRTCIDRLQEGDESARGELPNVACERLMRLTRRVKRRWRAAKLSLHAAPGGQFPGD